MTPAHLAGNPFNPSQKNLNALASCKKVTDIERAKKQGAPLIICCTLDLTKGLFHQGNSVRNGISLYIDRYNQTAKRPIKVIFMDDEYTPDKARKNVEWFMKEYNSTIFLCNMGTPTLLSYTDLIKQGKIFLFFPTTGAPVFRKPDLKTLVHWRASYASEAKALTEFIINQYGSTAFGFLYQNDAYGIGSLEASKSLLKNKRIVEAAYERNTTSFSEQIKTLSDLQALGFFSTAIAATEFIRQAGAAYFIGKKLFGLSDLTEESFRKFIDQKGIRFIIAQFTPNPLRSNLEIVEEYRVVSQKKGYPVNDIFALEGYIGASIAINLIDKTKDPTVNENLLETVSSIKDYSYKGFNLSLNPQTRELAHKLWIDTGDKEWIEQTVKQ